MQYQGMEKILCCLPPDASNPNLKRSSVFAFWDIAIEKGFAMPQEYYGSFPDNVEITDEKASQMIDYVHPDYYQPSEFARSIRPVDAIT